jgi:SAM-dependent methyltransferase
MPITASITAMASGSRAETSDTIIEAIRAGRMNAGNISYQRLRSIAGRDCGCWNELGRGRAILTSHDQLDQYLYSYGPMTADQWDQVLARVQIPPGRLQIVDYGCGQGLASALLFDHFGARLANRTSNVVLIEPSALALARAEFVLHCYAQAACVEVLNKKLDDLRAEELKLDREANTIHLFSNVLDLDSFHHIDLFGKILKTKGRHLVLCVSHDRDFYGGSPRFYELSDELERQERQGRFSIQESTIRTFSCRRGVQAISLELNVEVHDESV